MTTIVLVGKNNDVVVAGDGQVNEGWPMKGGKAPSKGSKKGKGLKIRRYRPFSSSKGGWKGHPGGRPPARPNPGLCDMCNSPDHWRDQCPPNPGATGGKPAKGGFRARADAHRRGRRRRERRL